MTIDYDVAIIGAGPSGCACALALHGKGIKVALFDKDVLPRDKVCGDTIPGPSFKGIDSVNVNWGNQLKAFTDKMDVTRTTVYASATKSISYQWLLYSYNSKRVHFDNFLFQLVKNETSRLQKKPLVIFSFSCVWLTMFFSVSLYYRNW